MTSTPLADRLDRIRDQSSERIPESALQVMHRVTRELQESGRADEAVGVGDRAPGFELPDSRGRTVSLSRLLERGPLVLSFFRGHW